MVFNRQNSSTGVAQYPIPQFIEAEGKIINFLTFRQFFILIGGGAVCLFLYYVTPFFVFVVLSIVVALLTAAIAFVKINNTSVLVLVLNFLKFSTESKNYVWKKVESPYPFKIKRHFKIDNPDEFDYAKGQSNSLKDIKRMVELRKK